MKTTHIFILFCLFCSLTISWKCNNANQNHITQRELTEKNVEGEIRLKEWRTDTLGCLGYRNFTAIQFIIDTLKINGKSTDFVIENLGYPNNRKQGLNSENFYYYFATNCEGNAIVDSLDFCWLELLIVFGRVTQTDISCL